MHTMSNPVMRTACWMMEEDARLRRLHQAAGEKAVEDGNFVSAVSI